MRERSTNGHTATKQPQEGGSAPSLTDALVTWQPVLDALGTNVFVADQDLNIVFANKQAMATLRRIDGTLREQFSVGADQIVGGSIHRFHRDPQRVERILHREGFTLPHEASFRFGDVVLQTTINAAAAIDGTELGYVVAWEEVSSLEQYREGVSELLRSFETSAAAVEEMTASIGEIAESSNRVASTTSAGVEEAQKASSTVHELGEASSDIGDVVETIADVAEQTNLLALNATIEAARAGDAGKGFAVVADEVKQLSRSTAQATDRIGERIKSLQGQVGEVVAALERISERLAEVDELQSGVAASAEEQRAATDQLSQSVNEAARDGRALIGEE
ncbi:MAG: methyl-accepting chemotaxis protein [Actinomycetota bacterium]